MVQTLTSPFSPGRRVLVVGLGLHGGAASAIRWFARQGARLRIQDVKSRPALLPTIKKLRGIRATYHFGGHPAEDFDWAEIIYVNQGVPLDLPPLVRARRQGKPIVNETTLFFLACPAPLVGVTGTRGKSTTTVLLSKLLEADHRSVVTAGNLRQTMMLDVLSRLTEQDLVVLELSSFQLEYLPAIRQSPRVAVMTNLKVDHLNRYVSLAEYADAKYNILRWQHQHDIAVLNADNAWTRRAAPLTAGTIWWFQTQGHRGHHGVTLMSGWVTEYTDSTYRRLFSVSTIHLAGKHNVENVLAATAAARAMNVPPATIRRVVSSFSGLPHRQERVRRWRGHDFYNDTTATTPDGTLAALDVFPSAVLIVGGTDKALQYGELARRLAQHQALVFLPGSGTEKLLSALRRAGDRRHHEVVSTMSMAVRRAVAMAQPKQPIVLSPGAASFGLFVHEFDRGDQFIRAVRQLR